MDVQVKVLVVTSVSLILRHNNIKINIHYKFANRYNISPLGCVGGSFVGLGLLKDICLREWTTVQPVFSNVEFRRVSNAELLGFRVAGSRGGNGGGEISSLGGRIGLFGTCFTYIWSKFFTFLKKITITYCPICYEVQCKIFLL